MLNINIKCKELDNKIDELRTMRTSWDSYQSTVSSRPENNSSGPSPELIETISTSYESLYNKVCEMMDNTILFLENLNNTMKEKDMNISNTIGQQSVK